VSAHLIVVFYQRKRRGGVSVHVCPLLSPRDRSLFIFRGYGPRTTVWFRVVRIRSSSVPHANTDERFVRHIWAPSRPNSSFSRPVVCFRDAPTTPLVTPLHSRRTDNTASSGATIPRGPTRSWAPFIAYVESFGNDGRRAKRNRRSRVQKQAHARAPTSLSFYCAPRRYSFAEVP